MDDLAVERGAGGSGRERVKDEFEPEQIESTKVGRARDGIGHLAHGAKVGGFRIARGLASGHGRAIGSEEVERRFGSGGLRAERCFDPLRCSIFIPRLGQPQGVKLHAAQIREHLLGHRHHRRVARRGAIALGRHSEQAEHRHQRHGSEATLDGQSFALAAGDELVLLPQIEGMYAGGDCKLSDLRITLGGASPAGGLSYKLPAAWEGTEKGSASGNPIVSSGQPVWRIDRLYPADAIMTNHYSPMVWEGTSWIAPDHSQGGHPSAKVGDGNVRFGAMGPWGGDEFNYPKIPALAFIAPESGLFKVTGTAKSKPWEGTAKTIPLTLRKNDTQRAAEVKTIALPRDGTPVPFEVEVELTAGHELLFVPMMHGLNNNASTITIEDLIIRARTP